MLSVAVPMTFAPSKNWTVPVGVPVPVTVAVKVTACPAVDGFAEELTAVLVALPFTVCVSTAEVLPAESGIAQVFGRDGVRTMRPAPRWRT